MVNPYLNKKNNKNNVLGVLLRKGVNFFKVKEVVKENSDDLK